jgi:glycosyltransferase involved in cell wall biosynthesis
MTFETSQLTIGIPIRNEEKTLKEFIYSLRATVELLDKNISIETIVCLNGSSDNSERIINDLIEDLATSRIELQKIHSVEGKINAQNAIVQAKRLLGPICFFDADVLLDENCLAVLWNTMITEPFLQVAYAQVQPINTEHKTLIEWLQSIHYKHFEILTPRKYFHGRGYILRSCKKLGIANKLTAENMRNNIGSDKYHRLKLERGPQIDDVYLSRVIAHECGLDSIKEVQNTTVYFVPPRTLYDFYQGQKRLMLEILRLNLLFPEHAYLQENHFTRHMNHRAFKTLSISEQIHYLGYQVFESVIKILVRGRLWLSLQGILDIGKFWVPLKTTKRFYKR